MSFKRFCPKCGRETEDIVRGMCRDCFLERNDLFSVKESRLPVCVKCGKLEHKNAWKAYSDADVEEEIASKVKVSPDLKEPKVDVEVERMGPFEYEARINVKGFIDDVLMEQEKYETVKAEKVSCGPCMKLVSNYREAVLQLRASSREEAYDMYELARGMIEREKASDSLSGIVKTINLKNGYDLWIGSKKAAAKVARYLGKLYRAQVKKSATLIGEAEAGKPEYRHTFLVKK